MAIDFLLDGPCSCATNSETKEEIAIKKIGNAFENRIDAKRTLREIKLLSHTDHENVFSFHFPSLLSPVYLYQLVPNANGILCVTDISAFQSIVSELKLITLPLVS